MLGLFGGVKIGGSFGAGRPIFREDAICFNGRPRHEPLVIYRVFHRPQQELGEFGLYWDFVKTDQKPYDELVVAVLVSFKHHFPAAALPSDGGKRNWARGIALYRVERAGRSEDYGHDDAKVISMRCQHPLCPRRAPHSSMSITICEMQPCHWPFPCPSASTVAAARSGPCN
jgi:hypothetical protein